MNAPPIPADEATRLDELHRLRVLDSSPEEGFDRIVRLASRLLGTPIALISLVDEHRQWFKAKVGLEAAETPREHAFCAHAINEHGVFVVPDATLDPRFAQNPLVTGEPKIRFYAGAPLRTESGALGTLCVIDRAPRTLTADEARVLEDLSATIVDQLRLRHVAASSRYRLELLDLAEQLASVGHWRLDNVQRKLFWSPQVFRIHGFDPDTFQPELSTALDVYHPDDRDTVTAQVTRAMEERVPFDFEARILRPDGEARLVRAVGRAEVDDDTDTVRGIFGVFHDLTEERRITERLALAERMASIGTLAAGMAHEINNPLAYIQANAEALSEELSDAPRRYMGAGQMLADIEQGAQRIRRIIEGLKSFSTHGGTKTERVDLRRVFEVAERLCVAELRQHARLSVELDREALFVDAEETQLVQVAVNLLLNAAHAFEPGRAAENTVQVTSGVSGEGRVYFDVSDTGEGMSPEVARHAFSPFFTTRPTAGGTGLGLAICHGIVSSFGGEIEIASEPGRGTTVRVALPRALESSRRRSAVRRTSAVTSPARVLLVDDEAPVARAIARLLRAYDVVVELNPTTALARLESGEAFDVVLCDLMMPDVTGPQLYAALERARPELVDRFIVITGGAFSQESREFLERAPVPVLFKPVSGEEVCEAVERCVASRVAEEKSGP